MLTAKVSILLSFLSLIQAWDYVNELRLAGELRVVNEGLTHDDTHWILSNQHFLYTTTDIFHTGNHHAIPEDLTKRGYNHIGDIDCMDGIVYGGIEGGDANGYLAAWNATDLSFIKYAVTEQHGVPWLAIDYDNRELYSANWNACCAFEVYDLDSLEWKRSVEVSQDQMPKEIQGAAFYEGDMYVSVNGNVSVYKINVTTGAVEFVLSDEYIEKHSYEMEGLTFWDLEQDGLGTMHLYGNFMEVKEKAVRNFKV